jgi:2',3'-cyclic-nucleotide 2'-phosphodiesterase (5'-nucleotidase family)
MGDFESCRLSPQILDARSKSKADEQVELTIVHFNDVVSYVVKWLTLFSSPWQYHVSDADLVARFATFIDHVDVSEYIAAPPLRVFSGDVFSPSLEASVLRGEHMTKLLNDLNIDVACYGNHG